MDENLFSTNGTGQARFAPLTWWNKIGLVLLALIIIAFACLVEKRSAFMQRRMTDAGVYFRAAWAVRSGADLYHIADDNDWHYNYPPLLAILMEPLADAPAGAPREGLLPYPVSVALWFGFNLLCVIVAVHWLARALEQSEVRSPGFRLPTSDFRLPTSDFRPLPCFCRAWWAHRIVPLLICLPPVAHTLMRGQVNLLLLLLIAGMLGAYVRGRNAQAGMWLAGAICLKIIPAFLLLYPLWRRDWRFLAGTSAGLVVGLGLIPGIVLGPQRTVECYRQLAEGVLRPGLTNEGDPTRAKELTNITGTGSQSFVVVWHNTLHLDRATRPNHAEPWLRLAALAAGGLLALVTLWAAQRRFRRPGPLYAAEAYLAWGALILVMLFSSPVSHMHYQCLCLPLVMGLLVLWPPRGWLRWGWLGLAGAFYAAHTLPHVPELSELRDFGMAMYVGLLMWLLAVLGLALANSADHTGVSILPQMASGRGRGVKSHPQPAIDIPSPPAILWTVVHVCRSLTQKSLSVTTQQFLKNRQQLPLEELAKYAGKYVAWNEDGTAILADDDDPIRLIATVKSLGHDPAEILISSVPPPDLVILGGGGFAE